MNLCTTCKYHVFGAMVPIPTGKPDEPPVMTAMGWCYRYPPQVTGQGMSSSPPVKSETTWCGEWRTMGEVPTADQMEALQLRCKPMRYDDVAKAMDVTRHAAVNLAQEAARRLEKIPTHPQFHLVETFAPLKSSKEPDRPIKWMKPDGTRYEGDD